MDTREQSSIKDAIHFAFQWIRDKKPGQVMLDWTVTDRPSSINLSLVVPSANLTAEEEQFLPDKNRVFSVNGDAPPSFRHLAETGMRLDEIGGEFSLEKAGKGLTLNISVPVEPESKQELSSKLQFIQNEIQNELQQGASS